MIAGSCTLNYEGGFESCPARHCSHLPAEKSSKALKGKVSFAGSKSPIPDLDKTGDKGLHALRGGSDFVACRR